MRCYRARAGTLILAWATVTAVLVGVGAVVVRSAAVSAFDRHATSVVVMHRTPALDAAMKALSWFGSWVTVVVAASALLALGARRIVPWVVVLLAGLAWAGEAAGVNLAKPLVGRPRPPQHLRLVAAHGGAWPSGHVATAALVFAVLATTLGAVVHRRRLRVVTWVGALLVVSAVAFSRVELGAHWTTDVIASVVFVTSWLVVMGLLGYSPKRTLSSAAFPDHADHEPGSPT